VKPSQKPPSRLAILDRPGSSPAQAGGAGDDAGLVLDGSPASGRFSAGLLIQLRWLILVAELVALLVAGPVFGLRFPLPACISVVALSAIANLAFSLGPMAWTRPSDDALALQLGFSIVQMAALLALTGGSRRAWPPLH
jgi:hypothetical protein